MEHLQLKGAVPKVQLAVVEPVETTIFSAMVITYWTAPVITDAKRQVVRIMRGYSLNAAASQSIRVPSLEALWRLGKNPGIVRRNLKPRLS